MAEILRGRRNVLQTMDDSELIRRYRLDRAGIVFVSDLIREKLTSPTQCRNESNQDIKIFGNWENATMQQ